MGRGRAKAKQTKVARALKYYSPSTDLSALEHELHESTDRFTPTSPKVDAEPETDDYDEYGKWASGGR